MNNPLASERERPAVVIITGASSGLGASLTRLLDRTLPADVALWLIARNPEKLEGFAGGLEHESRCFALDLKEPEAALPLERALEEVEPRVQLLINNAGEGCSGSFCDLDRDSHLAVSDLNIRAQLLMTSLVRPYMEAGSSILFTASVAAFLPQPGFAAYAASKAFILSFGRALREELKGEGIGVTVTCPNPMLTDFFTEEQKKALLSSYKRFGIEDPDRVAEKTLQAIRRKKGVVVTSPSGRLIRFLSKILPAGWIIHFINFK